MPSHTPTSSRYLVGSLSGSFVGAVVLALASSSWLADKAAPTFFPFVLFLTPFLFAVFLIVGWPLFLWLRGTRWFRLPFATGVGAVAGIAATVLFGGPSIDLVSLVFAVTGVLSTSVCWWFISNRPNPSFKRDALKRAP
jgi:hypothetical protein